MVKNGKNDQMVQNSKYGQNGKKMAKMTKMV